MSDSGSKPSKAASSADLSGRRLGGFSLLRRLGRGAMADVYLAEQHDLNRRVAVKILKPELARDRTYLQRFRREAQAAASLVHANIVQIYEVGEVDALHYIAQEYVEGMNLREWITRVGPPDLAHALNVMRQAAAALAKAAQQGIVHRDIKPENIMLTRTGEVKVADFGLARFAADGDELGLTQVGMTLGTPLYMSPEQVEGKPLDPRSDLYSLGVTCYHMLAGTPPFSGDTALAVAVAHLNKEPRRLEEVRPDLPPALCQVVARMLAKQPEQRHATPQDLLRDLRRVQSEHLGGQWPDDLPDWEGMPPETSGMGPSEATQRLDAILRTMALPAQSRHRAWPWAAGVILALGLGGAGAWLWTTQSPLLAGAAAQRAKVPKEENVLRQWWLASQVGSEDAWRAVIEYFPKSESFGYRAKQQLARLYLRDGNYRHAGALFDEFAKLDTQPEFRAFGLAGQCGILSLQGQFRQSADKLEELWPIRTYLRDPQLRQMLDYTVKRNRQRLDPQAGDQWQQWLEGQFGQAVDSAGNTL